MASISREANGRRVVQFTGTDRKRHSIRLGKVPQRAAETVKLRVELILASKLAGHAVDDETARWLAGLDEALCEKLAAVGLIPKRQTATIKLFLDSYIQGRKDIKPLTHFHLKQSAGKLVECFGENHRLRDVKPGDADRFRQWLLGKGLAENTTRRHCGRAKQFFRAAGRLGLVASNPFADVVSNVKGNASRFHFITVEDAQRVLEACPDAEWRLIFALARFGGLRCPSEHLALRWIDVDWERNEMRVPSPKTEHHEGRESRMVPIFPELRPYLDDAFHLAAPGEEFVIARYRKDNINLRQQLERIVVRAGLTPWQKPFQNLRSTRETELMEDFPPHVVCAWIGNSQAVAQKHYLQVTDDHVQRAVNMPNRLVQNPVQHSAERARAGSQPKVPIVVFSDGNDVLRTCAEVKAPRQGLEPWT